MDTETAAAQVDVPELELVKQAQAGDTEAFDQLVARFRNRVFAMIYNMVHNEQDAWDLAQDSFEKAIDQLSPEHRAVILMKEIEDMQYHEIAESLGCSIGTVMSRLFYARKKLQNLLRDVYENV